MTAVAAPAVTPRIGQVVRRWRFWAVVAAVILVIVVAQLVVTAGARIGGTFDPTAPGPQGARALAQVLREQGVAITPVASLDAARTATGTLLVDDSAGLLAAAEWRQLLQGRQRLVVASPSAIALRALAPGVRLAGVPNRGRAAADCDLALARRAGAMSLADVERSLRGSGAVTCFRDGRGAGQVVTLRSGGTRVLLLADRTAYTNEHIDAAGNASVALTALGATDRLTWYRPDPLEFASGRTLQQLTPPWVTPVAALLLLAGAAAALWRGRRLGPVVVERLPVLVRSRETVEGRARLYERGDARLRAADALRIGAIGRMAPMLGLSRSASVDEVIVAAARYTHRRQEALRALLLDDDPRTDRDVVRISDDLARLEAAVRAAVQPGATTTTKGTG